MKCKVVINLSNSDIRYLCTISTNSEEIRIKQISNNIKLDCDNPTEKDTKFIHFTVHTWPFWYFLNELNVSPFYRHCVVQYVNELNGIPILLVVPSQSEVIDYEWNTLTRHTAWEKVELDHLLSWLSTLGGAFSALGDSKNNCAEIAGKISFYQLELGLRFGDPLIVARSKLFVSLSLIQRGQLRPAKQIIRQQYEVAKKEEEYDPRLRKMCIGIWMKLQYAYQQRARKQRIHKNGLLSVKEELLKETHLVEYYRVLLRKKISKLR